NNSALTGQYVAKKEIFLENKYGSKYLETQFYKMSLLETKNLGAIQKMISEPYIKQQHWRTGHSSAMDDDKHVLRHLRTDSSLIVQNWNVSERDSERSEESIFLSYLEVSVIPLS